MFARAQCKPSAKMNDSYIPARGQENSRKSASGMLYLVATPIGNLQDMTFRALEVLKSADLIAAEDVQHSQKLLQRYDIRTPLLAFHEHNERELAESLVRQLGEGRCIALISDAGTPLLSDPGYPLVRLAIEAGIQVVPVPGASALMAALTASGLGMHRFHYIGFLAARTKARQKQLQALQQLPDTLVFYESPHRLPASLQDMQQLLGGSRRACLARELTKLHEEFLRGSLDELLAAVSQRARGQGRIRGECVVLVEGAEGQKTRGADADLQKWLQLLGPELPPGRLAAVLQKLTGHSRKSVYQALLEWQKPE